MASFAVWLVLLFGVSIGNATKDSLFPISVGLEGEDPFMPNERNEFDDCHLRYLRYGRQDLNLQPPPPPYTENREFSHVAAIGWTQSSGTIDWACMGALIWQNFVLTSARCTMDARNTAPDVVRLGEANPDFIQQRKISNIVRHPEFEPGTGRNDIALLRLDRRISVNTSVAPACLWLAPDTIFPKLQSVARTVQSEGSISTLETSPTSETKCLSAADRERALLNSQFCLEPTDTTKCFDAPAGNLLQVRLLHNYKTSPAIVGIMGGNRSTGSCRPASVFTRIGNYVDWIQEVLNGTASPVDFIPAVCALRNVHVRPRVDELLTERFDEIAANEVQVEFRPVEVFNYIVRIVWPSTAGQAGRNDCAGTFVDQSTILTLAECVATTADGHKPFEVMGSSRHRNISLPIKSITVHPGYVRGSHRNNIAVVKLIKPDGAIPACVWPFEDPLEMRVDMAAVGVSSLNYYNEDREDEGKIGYPSLHLRAIDFLPWSNCTAELAKYNQTLPGISKQEHVCLRNDQWIVPGSCDLLPGGPVQRFVARAGSFLKYAYALSVAGRSCGYGIPAVAILLQPHIPWLRSVIMDNTTVSGQEQQSESVFIINPDLKRSDECSNGDGTLGICVPHEMCLSTAERLRKGERVTLCSIGSVVCCPWGDIARNAVENPVRAELASCEARSRAFREQRLASSSNNSEELTNLAHVAEIGWPVNNGKIEFHCIGYLITTNTILTSASCAESQAWKPTVARIGSLNADDTSSYLLQPIRRVTVHEEYDDSTGVNNLALIQLTAHIKPTASYFPGCLYTNTTHVPVRQYGIIYARASLEFARTFPMYGKDCQERRNGEAVGQGQICYLDGAPESVFRFSSNCYSPGDLMVWLKSTEEELQDPEYLVAIFNHGNCRDRDNVQIATRIAFHYDWIVNNIK